MTRLQKTAKNVASFNFIFLSWCTGALKMFMSDKNHPPLISCLCSVWRKVTWTSRCGGVLLFFHFSVLLLGKLSAGRCCLCPCLPSWDGRLMQLREGRERGKKSPAKRPQGCGPLWTPNPRSLSTSGQPVPLSLLVGGNCPATGVRRRDEGGGGGSPWCLV